MAQRLADRVKETTTTTGTGAITLGGAMTGFQTFASICSNGDTCYYALQAVDANGNPTGTWETGLGTYATSGNTLTRTTILSSSNSGAAVTLPTGTTQVWHDIPAPSMLLSTLNNSGTNATVPVVALAPNGAGTNAGVALVPSGTGPLTASIPDGTATVGGNARGSYSVDWSRLRAAATQIASATGAVIGGGGNNTASGTYATVAGGGTNAATAGNATVGGGAGNTASNGYATIAGGNNNAASGTGSTVAGGYSNSAAGNYATVLGGSNNTASGVNSTAGGAYATTNNINGQVAWGFGSASVGQFQRTFTQVYASTTSTTAKVATANAATAATTNQLTLRANSAVRVRMYAVARDATNNTDAKEWTGDFLVTRGSTAASTAIVGSPAVTSTFATAGASGWSLAVTADTTNGALQVTVTSSTTDTVDWNAQLDSIEVM